MNHPFVHATSKPSFFYPSKVDGGPGFRSPELLPGPAGTRDRSTRGTISSETSCHETLRLPDGIELFYRSWIPRGKVDRALFLFHRGQEHSGRLEDVVQALGLEETAVFAWDARGHGRTLDPRGHAPSFAQWVRDQDFFVRALTRRHGIRLEETVLLGQSTGAVITAAWVRDYAPPIRGMILVSPAFRIKTYVPFALPGLRLLQSLKGFRHKVVRSYVGARMLTCDRRQREAYRQDPWITREISVSALLGLHDAGTRLVRDAGAIRTPTLILSGGADGVVHRRPQRIFFERLAAKPKEMKVFSKMRHDILHEKKRGQVFAEIRGFVAKAFEPATRRPSRSRWLLEPLTSRGDR